jgi:hypothetical protein
LILQWLVLVVGVAEMIVVLVRLVVQVPELQEHWL